MNCKTQENQKDLTPVSTHTTSQVKDSYQKSYSPDKSLILYYKVMRTPSDPAKHFEYFIENIQDSTTIYEGQYRGENISWNDNKSLKLTPYVGIIQQGSNDELTENFETSDNNNQNILKIK